MAIQWTHLWQALNDRQQHFLRTLYWAEADRAAYYNSQRAMFDPLKKWAQWRWLVHNPVGGGGLQRELEDEPDPKLRNNQGSGSTYKALEEAGYLDRRWETEELYSLAYGKRTVSVLFVRLTPRGRRLVNTIIQAEQGPVPLEEKRRELERQAWGKARFQGHDLEEWAEETPGIAVAECRLCGQAVRVNAGAKKAGRIEGLTPGRSCGGWRANPKNAEYQEAKETGRNSLAEKLQEKRGGRGYRQVIAAMQEQGLDKISACDLLRAEHGRPVAEDIYNQLCRWVGTTPEELKAEELKAEELPVHRGEA